MDQQSFDRIAKLLGGAASRRTGLRIALGTLVGLAAGKAAASKDSGTERHPKPEGPCGDRSRKDNVCTKHSQCCTGYCRTGLRNKDRNGRCRCAPKNEPCTKKTVCCGKLTCIDGTCRKGDACDVCPQGCAYSTVEEAWAATPDGGTIAVGSGTYPTAIAVDKSMTVTACDGADAADVVLSYRTGSGLLGVFDDPDVANHTLNLIGVTIDNAGNDSYGGVTGTSNLTVNAEDCIFRNGAYGITLDPGAPESVTITNCDFFDQSSIGLDLRSPDITVSGCTFTTAEQYGGAIIASHGSSVTISDCTMNVKTTSIQASGDVLRISKISATGGRFTLASPDCRISDCSIADVTGESSGGGMRFESGNFTVERTSITGCTAKDAGGGMFVSGSFDPVTLTLLDGVVVTGNTAPEGSGLAVWTGSAVTITGATTSKIYGNLTGDQCESSPDVITWTPAPSCWP